MAIDTTEEEKKQGDWLIVWADFITLLFSFFVLLWMMADNPKDCTAIRDIIESEKTLQDFELHATKAKCIISLPSEFLFKSAQADFDATEYRLTDRRLEILQQEVNAGKFPNYLLNELEKLYGKIKDNTYDDAAGLEEALFTAAKNDDGAKRLLQAKIVEPITSFRKFFQTIKDTYPEDSVVIEGHTDDVPIRRFFESNWELSFARALSIAKYLMEQQNYPAGNVSATGYAETRPKIPFKDEDGKLLSSKDELNKARKANRRVEIVVINHDTKVRKAKLFGAEEF